MRMFLGMWRGMGAAVAQFDQIDPCLRRFGVWLVARQCWEARCSQHPHSCVGHSVPAADNTFIKQPVL